MSHEVSKQRNAQEMSHEVNKFASFYFGFEFFFLNIRSTYIYFGLSMTVSTPHLCVCVD